MWRADTEIQMGTHPHDALPGSRTEAPGGHEAQAVEAALAA
jgi:hypothetical protein